MANGKLELPWANIASDEAADGTHTPKVQLAPVGGAYVDADVLAVTLGGSSQALFAANAARRAVVVQNYSSGDLGIGLGAAATLAPPSIKIPPGATWTMDLPGFVDTSAIAIIGATTGQAFAAKEA